MSREEREEWIIEFEALEEDVSLEDEAMTWDGLSQEDRKKQLEDLRKRLDDGDIYAFFCAKVTVTHTVTDFTETVYLGACSYNDEEDFKKTDYYKDMIAECQEHVRAMNDGALLDLLRDFDPRRTIRSVINELRGKMRSV